MTPADKVEVVKQLAEDGQISSDEARSVIVGVGLVGHSIQAFFEQYALEGRKPHAGEHFRQFINSLLIRAEEAGLYTPEKP